MTGNTLLYDSILATPAVGDNRITAAIRSSLVATLFEDNRSLFMAGVATAFVALVAMARLHQAWAALWLALDIGVAAAPIGLVQTYVARRAQQTPRAWIARFAPLAIAASLLLGAGTMACVMAGDAELTSLAIMVAAGILGGVASKNAALPRLATAQICLGAFPIGIGALLAPRIGYGILVPPLFLYVGAMTSIVRRHYAALVALMTAEQNHAELATRFDAALAHMPHGLCTIDETGKVIVTNRRTADLFGVPHEALRLNTPFPAFIGNLQPGDTGAADRAPLVERCTAWLAGDRIPLDLKLDDGRQLEITRNPVPDGSTIVILEDVTKRRRAEARILHWAWHDSLTGLPNRRDVCVRLERLLSQHAAEGDPRIALLYLDLDGFKHVNDSLGHYAGDEVLKIVADRLRGTLRRGQSAGRLGGDELTIVVENAERHACAALAKRVIDRLSDPYTLSTGARAQIGASAGIAFALKDESFEILMKRADTALYAAKAAGKGTFRFAAFDASGIESAPQ